MSKHKDDSVEPETPKAAKTYTETVTTTTESFVKDAEGNWHTAQKTVQTTERVSTES